MGISGHGDGEDRRRLPVARQDPDEDRGAAQDREDRLRQVAREVRLERVDALDRGRRQLARVLVVQVARPRQQQMAHEPPSQARHDARRAERPVASKPRGDQAAGDAHRRQPAQRGRDVGQRRAAQEDARDHVGEQRRLRDDEGRRGEAERDRRRQVRAGGRG